MIALDVMMHTRDFHRYSVSSGVHRSVFHRTVRGEFFLKFL